MPLYRWPIRGRMKREASYEDSVMVAGLLVIAAPSLPRFSNRSDDARIVAAMEARKRWRRRLI